MEEYVGLFAVDRDITRRALRHRVRGSSDVLGLAVLFSRLSGVRLDLGFLAQVRIRDSELEDCVSESHSIEMISS